MVLYLLLAFKYVLYLLLAFSGIGFQPNRPSSDLPGQANIINFPGNSQTTLFARQVLQVSNQTGPRDAKCARSPIFSEETVFEPI